MNKMGGDLSTISKELSSKTLDELEAAFMQMEQANCPVTHSFSPGQYVRELKIPAGVIAMGHKQRFDHLNIFVKGRVTMFNEDGTTTELKAPMTFVGKPGRKIGYVHEEVTWLNVYATEEKDVETLEEMFFDKSEASLKEIARVKEGQKLIGWKEDVEDFKNVIEELGYSEDQVRLMSENTSDMMDLPFGSYKIKVSKSNIEGQGLLATGDIKAGEIIAPARVRQWRTIAGRYTNHAKNPNATMLREEDRINLVALKDIKGCHGGFDGEEITIDYYNARLVADKFDKETVCLD